MKRICKLLPIRISSINISTTITTRTFGRWSTVTTHKWVLLSKATPLPNTFWSAIWRMASWWSLTRIWSGRLRSFSNRTTSRTPRTHCPIPLIILLHRISKWLIRISGKIASGAVAQPFRSRGPVSHRCKSSWSNCWYMTSEQFEQQMSNEQIVRKKQEIEGNENEIETWSS